MKLMSVVELVYYLIRIDFKTGPAQDRWENPESGDLST